MDDYTWLAILFQVRKRGTILVAGGWQHDDL